MRLFTDQHHWAFLFPGIGVKPFGREGEFYSKYLAIIDPYLKMASEAAGVDLGKSLLAGTTFDNDQLSRELFAYSFSYACYQVFLQLGLQAEYMAGHSLGVYAALAGAESISFEQGLELTLKAHNLGRKCCPRKKFGVVVIIGLDHSKVQSIIHENNFNTINLANLNNDCSGVYVGCRQETDDLLKAVEQEGAIKTIRLRIDIPFHNPLFMENVSHELRSFLETLNWSEPSCPVISSLDSSLCTTIDDLISLTTSNIALPIDWPGVMNKLNQLGVHSAIECGQGVSLTQHARFIEKAPRHYNLKNLRRRLDY